MAKKTKAIPINPEQALIIESLKKAEEAAEAIQAAQVTIQGFVDTLEPNQAAMEAAQVAIQAAQVTMQDAQAAIQAAQAITQGKVDAADTKVVAVDGKVIAVGTKVDGVSAQVTEVSGKSDVVEGKVDGVAGVVNSMFVRIGASRINVTKTLSQGVEPIHTNLFSFDKPFVILGLFGIVTRVGNSDDIDDCFFNAADDVGLAEITKDAFDGGVDLSGCVVGSLISKGEDITIQAIVHLSDAVKASDTKWNPSMCQVTAKNGVPNYIRFTYDSDPASGLDMDINFIMWYQQIDDENPAVITEA